MSGSSGARNFHLISMCFLIMLVTFADVEAGQALDMIKKRGHIKCGVSEGRPGFSLPDANGRWAGLDADFCRAVSAALFGSGEKVTFVPLKASERFPALRSGAVDIVLRATTWTFEREAGLKMSFPGVLYYDSQRVMVPVRSGIKKLSDLHAKTICLVKGTTHEKKITALFTENKLRFHPLILDSSIETEKAFYSGRCDAYASDASNLVSVRKHAPDGAERYRMLEEIISKEPLGPVVRQGDEEWASVVRWVLFILIAAEENNVTQNNVRSILDKNSLSVLAQAVKDAASSAKTIGLRPDWAERIILTVGNYGELFERTVGKNGVLGIDRGINNIWKNGGLMYAPPLR